MMYTRASASDYDDWKTVYENPGWGSNDLIPLLRKVDALSYFTVTLVLMRL
jgi:alcohol oxidase